MKWLFLMFVFDVSGANLKPKLRTLIVFESETACEEFGRGMSIDYKDPKLRSFSHCIPEKAFDLTGMQTDKFE